MYQDYLDDIVRNYKIQAGNASLPQRLIRPTPAGIKKECQAAFQVRFQNRDLRMLTAFFSAESDHAAIAKAINRCDIDRFKPLCNFLKRDARTTDDLNIELLGWLIDFPNRPYKPEEYLEGSSLRLNENQKGELSHKRDTVDSTEEDIAGNNTITDPGTTVTKEEPHVKNNKQVKFFYTTQKIAVAVGCTLLLSIVGFYFVTERKPGYPFFNGSEQKCMIWVGDHYEPSSCETKHGDTLLVALDLQKLHNFRRITRPDTITLLSEGKLWYIKRNGHIEYYTAGGRHPVEPDRVLRPLTRYMILKYQGSPER